MACGTGTAMTLTVFSPLVPANAPVPARPPSLPPSLPSLLPPPLQPANNTVSLVCDSGRQLVLVEGADAAEEGVMWEMSVGRGTVRLVRVCVCRVPAVCVCV